MKEKVYDEDTGCVIEKDTPGQSDGKKEESKGPVVKLNSMALRCFINTWSPCKEGEQPTDRLRIIDLREHFQAYVTDDPRCIDLLPYYLDELEKQGYTMRIDQAGGGQYLPVKLIHR